MLRRSPPRCGLRWETSATVFFVSGPSEDCCGHAVWPCGLKAECRNERVPPRCLLQGIETAFAPFGSFPSCVPRSGRREIGNPRLVLSEEGGDSPVNNMGRQVLGDVERLQRHLRSDQCAHGHVLADDEGSRLYPAPSCSSPTRGLPRHDVDCSPGPLQYRVEHLCICFRILRVGQAARPAERELCREVPTTAHANSARQDGARHDQNTPLDPRCGDLRTLGPRADSGRDDARWRTQ